MLLNVNIYQKTRHCHLIVPSYGGKYNARTFELGRIRNAAAAKGCAGGDVVAGRGGRAL